MREFRAKCDEDFELCAVRLEISLKGRYEKNLVNGDDETLVASSFDEFADSGMIIRSPE